MKKIVLLILIILSITSCNSKSEEYPTIQDKLSNMKSYQTCAEITYMSNKGTTTYNTVISAKDDGKYRIEVTSPEDFKGNVVMFDGTLVWQYNPHLENNKISANPPDKSGRREIILFSFLKNYAKSMETTVASANLEGETTTVLEAEMTPDSKVLRKEKLYVDNKTMNPIKLVLCDGENNEKVVVNFSDFSYNQKLDDKLFNLNNTGDDKSVSVSQSISGN